VLWRRLSPLERTLVIDPPRDPAIDPSDPLGPPRRHWARAVYGPGTDPADDPVAAVPPDAELVLAGPQGPLLLRCWLPGPHPAEACWWAELQLWLVASSPGGGSAVARRRRRRRGLTPGPGGPRGSIH